MSYQDFQGSMPDNPDDPYQTEYATQGEYGAPTYAPGPSYGAYQGTPPPDYRAWATATIIGGIFFSLIIGLPLGLVARVQSRRVRSMWQKGDAQGALRASRSARTWAIAATVFEVLGVIFLIWLMSRANQTTS